jgi:outer membrane protein insertion porin family
VNQTSTSSFKSRKAGGSVRLGFPLSDNLWVNSAYTLSHDDIYYVDPSTASLAVKLAAGGGNLNCVTVTPQPANCKDAGQSWTSSVGTSLTYDTRNHPRNPNRGLYLSVGPEFAGLGGDVQYVRVQGEARAYYPIYDKVTLVGRAVGGSIQGWGGDDVRLLDMFYKGGETVRGFYRAGIGPRDLNTRDSLGGQNFWAATAEVRFPLPIIPEELGISAAIFADAGSVWGASTQITKSNQISVQKPGANGFCNAPSTSFVCLADDNSVRAAVGASIMWQSPVGPLRLDYAHPLSKEKYDRVQQIRFGASTQF